MKQERQAQKVRDRRTFLWATTAATVGGALKGYGHAIPAPAENHLERKDLVRDIKRSVIWNGRAGGPTWFHPRACRIPGKDAPAVFMTLQSITGSAPL